MPEDKHEAVIVGAAAATLRSVLETLLEEPDVHECPDIFAAGSRLLARTADSIWIDADALGPEDVGAVRVWRAALPQCRVILLVGQVRSSEAIDGLVAIGCFTLRRPVGVRQAALVLAALPRSQAPADTALIAGLADQLNNPLAALAGRLQLLLLAAHSDDRAEFEDNIQLAITAAKRMQVAIEKLTLLAGRRRPLLTPAAPRQLIERSAKELGLPVRVNGSADLSGLADEELLGRVVGSVLRTSCDLSPSGVRVAVRRSQAGVTAVVELDEPLPLPCPPQEVLLPFRLDRILRDPDLGLDLAVAQALMELQSGGLEADTDAGLLSGFRLSLRGPG